MSRRSAPRVRLEHAASLDAWLRRVAAIGGAIAASTSVSGCCVPLFSSWQGGSTMSRVVAAPPTIARNSKPDQPLPIAFCREVCGADTCFPAELRGPSGVTSHVVVCNSFVPGECRDSNWLSMPSGRRSAVLDGADPTRSFAALARAEAESVDDFERFAADLLRLGAPLRLVRRAKKAACDEVMHARILRRWSVEAPIPPHEKSTLQSARRTLLEVAVENAERGCVGETWGAWLLAHQSVHATNPRLRRAFGRLAKDERRHASLAFAFHAWARGRLRVSERVRLDAAITSALARLVREAGASVSTDVSAALGLPPASLRVHVARAFSAELLLIAC